MSKSLKLNAKELHEFLGFRRVIVFDSYPMIPQKVQC